MIRVVAMGDRLRVRESRGGAWRPPSGSAGPDEVAGAVLGLDQGGVDRGREARIVELDRGVGPPLLRGLLPGGAELDVGGAGDDPEVRAPVVVLLDRDEAELGVRWFVGLGIDDPVWDPSTGA